MTGSVYLTGPRYELELGREGYPSQLEKSPDPPKVLHVLGSPDALRSGLAVVGARKATPYGLGCARLFAARAAMRGITIISGGAIGCDQEAHRAALDLESPTVAVLGCGANVAYPTRATPLFNDIIEAGGAVVAEAPWDAPPVRWAFVRRNRIIAGLATATLIVEAGLPSGTFSTADAALAAGRDVLAVPGSIQSPESRGCNRLLAEGATPIVDEGSFDAVLANLFGLLLVDPLVEVGLAPTMDAGVDDQIAWILRALMANPMRPDELRVRMGTDINQTMRLLGKLGMEGRVERYRDGRYGVPLRLRIPHKRRS
jgi:DNA processing protein